MVRVKALVIALGVAAANAVATDVHAQYVTYYRPLTTYYAPAPVVAPAAYTVASPVTYAVAAPVTYAVAAPITYGAAPVPTVTYYRAPTVGYARVPQVVTRWRPILGGTVSRVRYTYMPVVY